MTSFLVITVVPLFWSINERYFTSMISAMPKFVLIFSSTERGTIALCSPYLHGLKLKATGETLSCSSSSSWLSSFCKSTSRGCKRPHPKEKSSAWWLFYISSGCFLLSSITLGVTFNWGGRWSGLIFPCSPPCYRKLRRAEYMSVGASFSVWKFLY